MVKWKVALVLIATLVVALVLPVGAEILTGYLAGNSSEARPVTHAEIDFANFDNYLAGSLPDGEAAFDILGLLSLDAEAEVTIEEESAGVAEISDGMLSILEFDRTLKLRVSQGDESEVLEFITIDGFNIKNASELWGIAGSSNRIYENIVLFDDLNFGGNYTGGYKRQRLSLYKGFYGNGHTVSYVGCDYLPKITETLLRFRGEGVLRDTRFLARVFEDGGEVDLTDIGCTLVTFDSRFYSTPVYLVENCIFENALRNVGIFGSEVHFKRCLFQNVADSNISIETSTVLPPSQVTVEDCVLANAVVAGILNWCQEEATAEDQCTISLKGRVDFYNWKNIGVGQIVPDFEENSELYNNIFRSFLNWPDFSGQCVSYEDNNYVSMAVAVICNNQNGINNPRLTGFAAQKLRKYDLPLKNVIEFVLSTADIYGYSDDAFISPGDSVSSKNVLKS